MLSYMSRIHVEDPPLSPDDHFDKIPDAILLIILDKVVDARSLGRCRATCRRFNDIVPLVHNVYLKIDRVLASDGGDTDETPSPPSQPRSYSFLSHLKLMVISIFKPLHSLRASNLKPLRPQHSQHTPALALGGFSDLRNLIIELPGGDIGTEDGVVLRWRAEFGSTLQSCIILGSTGASGSHPPEGEDDDGSLPEAFCTDGSLKLRVVWAVSSLIAASTRHYLLRQVIKEHPTLRSVVFTDADGQGTLSMGQEQLREFREQPLKPSPCGSRTQVPASVLKLRYASRLDLPGGVAVQGATLVAIKPTKAAAVDVQSEIESLLSVAFDGPHGDVVRALSKRRSYPLEMNSF
ncbi:F-box protein At4g18380-like isoform X2 [Wolffia australiana]